MNSLHFFHNFICLIFIFNLPFRRAHGLNAEENAPAEIAGGNIQTDNVDAVLEEDEPVQILSDTLECISKEAEDTSKGASNLNMAFGKGSKRIAHGTRSVLAKELNNEARLHENRAEKLENIKEAEEAQHQQEMKHIQEQIQTKTALLDHELANIQAVQKAARKELQDQKKMLAEIKRQASGENSFLRLQQQRGKNRHSHAMSTTMSYPLLGFATSHSIPSLDFLAESGSLDQGLHPLSRQQEEQPSGSGNAVSVPAVGSLSHDELESQEIFGGDMLVKKKSGVHSGKGKKQHTHKARMQKSDHPRDQVHTEETDHEKAEETQNEDVVLPAEEGSSGDENEEAAEKAIRNTSPHIREGQALDVAHQTENLVLGEANRFDDERAGNDEDEDDDDDGGDNVSGNGAGFADVSDPIYGYTGNNEGLGDDDDDENDPETSTKMKSNDAPIYMWNESVSLGLDSNDGASANNTSPTAASTSTTTTTRIPTNADSSAKAQAQYISLQKARNSLLLARSEHRGHPEVTGAVVIQGIHQKKPQEKVARSGDSPAASFLVSRKKGDHSNQHSRKNDSASDETASEGDDGSDESETEAEVESTTSKAEEQGHVEIRPRHSKHSHKGPANEERNLEQEQEEAKEAAAGLKECAEKSLLARGSRSNWKVSENQ